MKSPWLKRIAWTVGVIVVLLVAAVIALPLLFDPNAHKERIVAEVEKATGRSFGLDGEIEWQIFPWISFAAGPLTLGEDPSFGTGEFLTADRVSADLALWPLFRGEVLIGDVRIAGPTVNLIVNEQGVGNWETLGSGQADPAPGSADSTTELSIQSLGLEKGAATFHDRSTGMRVGLSDLQLSIEPLTPDVPTEISLSSALTHEDQTGTFALAGSATDLLTEQPMVAQVDKLDVVLDGDMPLNFNLTETAAWRETGGELDLPGFEASSGALNVQGHGSFADVATEPRGTAELVIDRFNVKRWLAESGMTVIETADSDALTQFAANVSLDYQPASIGVELKEAQLDDTQLTGQVTVADAISFSLDADTINLDRYLPPESNDPSDRPASDDPVVLDFGAMTGRVNVAALQLAGLSMTNASLQIVSDDRGLKISPLTATMYQGKVQGDVALLNRAGQSPRAETRLKVVGLQAEGLLGDMLDSRLLTGIGNLDIDIDVEDPFSPSPMRGMSGKVGFQFNDGQLFGFDLFSAIRQVQNLVETRDLSSLTSSGGDSTGFTRLELDAGIDQGVLEIASFLLDSPYVKVPGDGSIDLNNLTLDMNLTPRLIARPGGNSQDLDPGKEYTLALKGDLLNPDLVGSLLSSMVESRIDQEKDKLAGRLRDRLAEELAGDDEEQDEQAGGERSQDEQSQTGNGSISSSRESKPDTRDRLKGALLDALEKRDESRSDENPDDGDGQ